MSFDNLRCDVRYGILQLRKSPAFTLAAVLTLALGIGANATIFSWLNSVILNPLPSVDSADLMSLRWHRPDGSRTAFSWPDYLDVRSRARTSNVAVGAMTALSLGDGSHPERIWGMMVSSSYFPTLGLSPAAGRFFQPDEDQTPGGHPVAVLGYRLWQMHFGADPSVIGREIRLNSRNFTVVGIAPQGFQGSVPGLAFDLYLPVTMREAVYGASNALTRRDDHWLEGYVRLQPGVNPHRAEEELSAISSQITTEFLHSNEYSRAELIPMWREGGGQLLGPVIMLMMGVVAVVLLIACANVANLLLARGAGRRREIGIRHALGVTRGRLVSQLFVENGLLTLFGCAGAMLLIPAAGPMLMSFAPPTEFPVSVQVHSNVLVFAFTLGVSVLATMIFGLLPALRTSNLDVASILKDDSGGSTGTRKAWLRSSLVVAQVTLSMVLLVGAGLLLKSLAHAQAADPGFDARNVLVAGVDLMPNGYDAPRGKAALRRMFDQIAAVPGVTAVSTIDRVPLGLGGSNSSSIAVDGYTPQRNEEMSVMVHTIGPDYFHAVNTHLLTGREFSPFDTESTVHSVVINSTLAQRYFGGSSPVGRRIRMYGENKVVVGVVRDSKSQSLDEKPEPAVYLSVFQAFASESNFLIRTAGDPLSVSSAIESAIHSVDPALPVYGQRTLETSISAAYFGQRMGGSLLGVFGGLALLLAAVGLYGVVAYSVTQRSREVGIRVALGASRPDVLRLILGHGLRLAAIGLTLGLALSIAVTRLMTSMLFAVSPTDVPTLLGVSAMLAAVAVAASFFPAWRAARIDPILAIRHD